MAKQNLGGVYANMDFPPYTYQEYPKHIRTGPYGKYEIANTAKDEEEIRTRLQLQHEVAVQAAEAPPPDPIRDSLIARALRGGIPINQKWSNQKIEAVIQEASLAMDDLPPEDTARIAPDENEEGGGIIASEEETKDELIAHAKSLGILANKLWGIPRLRTSIAEAEAAKK